MLLSGFSVFNSAPMGLWLILTKVVATCLIMKNE